MKEYIEREALIKEGWLLQRTVYGNGSVTIESKQLKDIPAADVVEVRHGRWIDSKEDGHPSICGVCNYPVDRFYKTKYCPNCGAKMDGGVNDAAD